MGNIYRFSDILRKISYRLILAYETPEHTIKILEWFEKMLSDMKNFMPVEDWGTKTEGGKKIAPFSFSEHANIKGEASGLLEHVIKGGQAGMADFLDALPYFLTHFIELLNSTAQIILFKNKKETSRIIDKIKKIESATQIDNAYIHNDLVRYEKGFTEERANKAKMYFLNLIQKIRKAYENLGDLTPEELNLFTRGH